jgi:transcriptional regulator with XRE-family HTH domain
MTSASRSKGEDVNSVPHPSVFIREEREARKWSDTYLAIRMGGESADEIETDRVALYMYENIGPTASRMRIGETTVARLSKAFGISAAFFLALENAWLAHLTNQEGQNR